MKHIRIAAVEYINTVPFLHSIKSKLFTHNVSVISVDPAQCAALYKNHDVDIALVPVGALDSLGRPYHTVTNYCIGSDGAVDTVAVLSDVPLDQLQQIVLDPHSRTSAALVQLLCRNYWNLDIKFSSDLNLRDKHIGHLLIGDKVKEMETSFAHKIDLGLAWKEWQKLPMVYAVWVAAPSVPLDIIKTLNTAFHSSIERIDSIPLNGYNNQSFWRNYLKHSIRYKLDAPALEGMETFLSLKKQITL